MEKKLDALVDGLKNAHSANLVSIVLYGSAVTGEYVEDQSNYNVLVVLNQIAPHDLQAAHPVIQQWHEQGHVLPLYFTREEMIHASDVFPIEFLDMSRAHKVLYGQDPLEGLEIPQRNLRHQLEYELRGKLIRLRELYISASKDTERLSALMTDSLSSFVVLFRHVLGLLGHTSTATKRETILELGERAGIEVTPFLHVLALREQAKTLSLDQATEYFTAYLKAVEAVIRRVDEPAKR